MKLSEQDADLFFELMWALQVFVNQRLQVLPDVKTLDAYVDCPTEVKMQVREALYENIELIDAFVEENPRQFSQEKLDIVSKWKQFVADDFYLERMLKKYAIFIAGDDKVYGVLALYDAFRDMIHPGNLPLYVKAVLLPFKGKIIYDGLFQGYNIYFGGGITSGLKETYMAAKQNGRIIDSFDPEVARAKKPAKPVRDWRPELGELVAKAKKLRGGSGQPPINSPAFKLVKASLDLAHAAVENPDDLDRLWKSLEKVDRAFRSVETTLFRSERYR